MASNDDKLSEWFTNLVVQGLIQEGHLDPRGKTDAQFRTEVLNFLHEEIISKPGAKFETVIDHTPRLLREARKYARA